MGTPTEIYASFVMTVVAQEDDSRAVWPSCPAYGWSTGVHKLDSRPNGAPLSTPVYGADKMIEYHGFYVKGTGFPARNGDPKWEVIHARLPMKAALPELLRKRLRWMAWSRGYSTATSTARNSGPLS